jgi:transglutaminase-like putative cysteine protease
MRARNGESLAPLIWTSAALGVGVLLHVDRLPFWVTATVVLWMGWRFASDLRSVRLPSAFAKFGVTLLMIGAVIAQFRTFNGLAAGTALLVVMGSLKLLETHTIRDRSIVIGASLFLLLAACLDRQSLLRAPLYLLHAWVCCTALAVTTRGHVAMTNTGAAKLAARSLALAAPLAIVMFLFFPRVVGGFWTLPQSGAATTGLSDSMSPGSISELGESDDPAFRVHFEGEPPPRHELYWRGPVLHDFDGYTWRQLPQQSYVKRTMEFGGKPYRYRVTLEPSGNRWWFALDTVVESPNRRRVQLTFDNQLVSRDPVTTTTTYEAVSHTLTRELGPIPIIAQRVDTRLPEGRNPRSIELARRMRAAAESDERFISDVMNLFRTGGFEYTLTPPLLDLNSVDDFLFNTRKGFCGHYASAFVTMMRAAGVPARVVTGYHGGEWNRIREYFLVRQSDAHAWAEVWLDGRGWTRFDPTAAAAPQRLTDGLATALPEAGSATDRLIRQVPWLEDLRQRWDALNDWWNERVVKFDLQTQLALMSRMGFSSPDWTMLGYLLAAGLVVWMLLVAWQIGRGVRPAPPDRLAKAYQKLCARLARAGVPREPHVGPLAYATAIGTRRPDIAPDAKRLLETYMQLRFGNEIGEAQRTDAIRSFERAVGRFHPARGT